MSEETEILLCLECNGVGTKSHEVLIDHHKGDYETRHELCRLCKGQGRIRKTTTTEVTITPYDNPKVKEIMFKKLKDK